MSAPNYFIQSDDKRIAYHRTPSRGEGESLPGVVFLGGFKSDMEGSKALHLEAWAAAQGRAFLRFDYTGHGQSSGLFEDGCIGDWAADAGEALAELTSGPQILVGSSMGGWIALLLALAAPNRIAGLVGIAAAPDFTEDSMWADMDEATRQRLHSDGRIELPSDYSDDPYIITRKLIEDGRTQLVLRQPLNFNFPVHLLQGTADTDVDVSVALRLLERLDSPDARLTLVDGADHRFSEPRELALLIRTVEQLLS
jgi:pimeloyl-ACP methyl ester carboxylesterase